MDARPGAVRFGVLILVAWGWSCGAAGPTPPTDTGPRATRRGAPGSDAGTVDQPSSPVLARFPAGFQFGFATVAHQSEGTRLSDGSEAQSNWSEWEHLGKVQGQQLNDHGNGFYDGYEAELDRAASLGANAFSYALDWSKIEPAEGIFDEGEVARAVRIVRAIRARQMRPLIILFHWVAPTWVQSPVTGVDLLERANGRFVDAFLPFAGHMVEALGGLVDDWVTFEEPWSLVGAEYLQGEHPPGHTFDILSMWGALVNLEYMNAATYHLVHQVDQQDADGDGVNARVGVEIYGAAVYPLNPQDADDVSAAAHFDYIINHNFLRAILQGDVDLDFDGSTHDWFTVPNERHDPALMNTADFIGINYYQAIRVEGGWWSLVPWLRGYPHIDVREYDVTVPHSDMYQEISAPGLRKVIEELSVYGLPLVVTETGIADARDDRRPFYELEHLRVVGQAIADGYDVRGFYSWTVSDNFEWEYGLNMKFGVFRVDFTDPAFPRTRLESANVLEAIYKAGYIDQQMWDRWSLRAYPVGPVP